MSNVSYKNVKLLWYAKTESINTKNLCLLSQIFPPGLPNLGAQIRFAQKRYITVQTDLKYPWEDRDAKYRINQKEILHNN